jgi:hypothetical protein
MSCKKIKEIANTPNWSITENSIAKNLIKPHKTKQIEKNFNLKNLNIDMKKPIKANRIINSPNLKNKFVEW